MYSDFFLQLYSLQFFHHTAPSSTYFWRALPPPFDIYRARRRHMAEIAIVCSVILSRQKGVSLVRLNQHLHPFHTLILIIFFKSSSHGGERCKHFYKLRFNKENITNQFNFLLKSRRVLSVILFRIKQWRSALCPLFHDLKVGKLKNFGILGESRAFRIGLCVQEKYYRCISIWPWTIFDRGSF